MILTDSEIMDINQNAEFDSAIGYARKIESAVIEKLKAHEPICHINAANVAHLRHGILQSNVRVKRNPEKHTVPLYTHPLPPADVVRDPRVAELEAVLRECREALVKNIAGSSGRTQAMHEAILKIDEVLNENR